MRISDWSSDVCSSDLIRIDQQLVRVETQAVFRLVWPIGTLAVLLTGSRVRQIAAPDAIDAVGHRQPRFVATGRESVVLGKSGAVSVDTVGCRILKQKRNRTPNINTNITND